MERDMPKPFVPVLLLILLTLTLPGCDKPVVESPPRQTTVKELSTQLASKAPIEIKDEFDGDGDRIVYLIGENHASVANQLELVKLLDVLRSDHGIDRILVEGSNGPFELSETRRELSQGKSGQEFASYLETQLNWGRIAGYELTALLSPDVVVFGVEDMGEKLLYAMDSTSHESTANRLEIESLQIGVERLRTFLSSARENFTQIELEGSETNLAEAEMAIDDFEQAIKVYSEAIKGYSDLTKPVRESQRRIVQAMATLQPAFEEYGRDLGEISRVQKQYSDAVDDYNTMVRSLQRKTEEFNRGNTSSLIGPGKINSGDIERFLESRRIDPNGELARTLRKSLVDQQLGTGLEEPQFGSTGKFTIKRWDTPLTVPRVTPEELEGLQRKLLAKKREIDRYEDQLKRFERRYGNAVKELNEVKEQQDTFQKSSELELAREKMTESDLQVQDAFAHAANELLTIARPLRIDVSSIQNFWSERGEWRSQRVTEMAVESLLGRDRAMAENTVRYMQDHNVPAAALIVGYAHVKGLATQFRERGVSFVGMRLKSVDAKPQPWETRAWGQRITPTRDALFSADELKELSPLLNETWRREEAGRFKLLSELPTLDENIALANPNPTGASRIHEGLLGDGQVLITSGNPIDRNANYGEFLRDQGPVSGNPGAYFQIYDRNMAVSQIKAHSNADTIFAYAFKISAFGDTQYRIATPGGTIDARQFAEAPPQGKGGTTPKRVVLIREPDEQRRAGVTFSPLLDRLHKGASGGGNDGPPPGNRTAAAADAPEPGKRGSSDQSVEKAASGNGGNRGNGGRGTDGRGPFWTHIWLGGFASKQKQNTILYQSINPERASKNLSILDRQAGNKLGKVEFIEEGDLSTLPFSTRDGEQSRTVVLRGANTQEFRAQIEAAAANGKLRNKQVALITCGDVFVETASLREAILEGGALMVWVPERQLSISQGQKLRDFVKRVVEELGPAGETTPMSELMSRALQKWQQEQPDDSSILLLQHSSFWVRVQQPDKADQS